MTNNECYYQPLPAHWGDHVRDAYFAVNWPLPNKVDFAVLSAVGGIAATVILAIIF